MFKKILNVLSGDPFAKELGRYKEIVEEVASHEPRMQSLTDEELRAKTDEFREIVRQRTEGITDDAERSEAERNVLAEIMGEAFAVVREASVRTTGLRHYDVQIIGGITMTEGKIAEMKTGEGKTLVASLPLYLNALLGRGVHLVTVNDYLVRRDGGWMGPIFDLLGLSVGAIGKERYSAIYDPNYVDPTSELEDERLVHWRPVPRKEAYLADVTYGTASEFGFDYLRDNTSTEYNKVVQRERYYAIVDEIDSVLIDGARTPLIISGPARKASDNYQIFAEVVEKSRLRRNTTDLDDGEEPDGDYVYDDRTRSVSLTDSGIEKVERLLPMIDPETGQSIYDPEYYELVSYLDNALKAKYVFKRDKDYFVQDGNVILIDQTTGRAMPSRRYSEGLHQAIEAKEGVSVKREDETIATITVQSYFRLYNRLAGMTGTALTQAEEFDEVYRLDVIPIPTNVEFRATEGELRTEKEKEEGVPVITYYEPDNNNSEPDYYQRIDYADEVYLNENGKFKAAAHEIADLYELGRPVLVGTGSVESSEILSRELNQLKVPHEVLNAKNNLREALIVAQAGRPKSVTISTNMAGRGTDILLGGNPEGLASKAMADASFTPEAFERLVKDVAAGNIDAAEKRAEGERGMSTDLIPWIQKEREKLVKKAQVGDLLEAVITDIEGQYPEADHDIIVQLVRQVDLSSFDARRIDKAREMVDERGLPASLLPDIEFALSDYSNLKNLLGQQGFDETVSQRLYEKHYNARAALVRHVLAGEIDEARHLTEIMPALSEDYIQMVLDIMEDCRQEKRHVWEKGGLHVIGTERHESRRIDDQLRGRAGRQGDPGSSKFFLSMEDELMLRFGGNRSQRIMARLNVPEDQPISANVLSNAIEQSQGKFEGYYFEIRKNLVEYDEAVNRQREIVYGERRSILSGDAEDLDDMILNFVKDTLRDSVDRLAWNFEEWAEGEVATAIGDYSNVETGEVNARAAVRRVLTLFPRPSQEELDDLSAISDGEELAEALMEVVRDGMDRNHNLRMLHAEIARMVPLWPVVPPFGKKGVENYEAYAQEVLKTFEDYAGALSATQKQQVRSQLESDLSDVFRKQIANLGKGDSASEVKSQLDKDLGNALNEAMQVIIVETEPGQLVGMLLDRVGLLLDIARMDPEDDEAEVPTGWPLDKKVYAIGDGEMGNYQRAIMLSNIDREWRQYLKAIDDLKQSASLAAFGQRDPKVEFKRSAFDMFDRLRDRVQEGIANSFFRDLPRHRQIVQQQQALEAQLDQAVKFGYRIRDNKKTGGRANINTATVEADVWAKTGRNDPCPCGSGKKYKDCHYNQIRKQMAQQAVSADKVKSRRNRRRR